MTFYANDVHPIPPDHCAPDCDDQLPLISRVGRGIKGDSFKVDICKPDAEDETHLEGKYYDAAAKAWIEEPAWVSENINGGKLSCYYNLRPSTIPQTFTITFDYSRPGRQEWEWTTPAIPYIWSTRPDGSGSDTNPDHIVGSGVGTLYIRANDSFVQKVDADGNPVVDAEGKPVYEKELVPVFDENGKHVMEEGTNHYMYKETNENRRAWDERLFYPDGTDGKTFNTPYPEEPWSSTITFGHGGDIDVPSFSDLAKIIGITKEELLKILDGIDVTIKLPDGKEIKFGDLIEYINNCDAHTKESTLDHVHADLGFDDTLASDEPDKDKNNYTTVKEYIDYKVNMIINGDKDHKGIIQQILEKIVGGEYNVVDPETGEITWKYDGQIAIGNINLYSNATDNDEQTAVIRCHDGSKVNDVQVK